MKAGLRALALSSFALLSACATTAPRPRPATAPIAADLAPAAVAVPAPEPSTGPAPVAEAEPQATSGQDPWQALRDSFAMPDCNADPSILAWARRFTQSPGRFQSQMREVLPQLDYVRQIAVRHGVAGEFVLLPWVESHYQPLLGRKNRPAGMWQIMPTTAGTLGLRMDGGYDGRLDVSNSADAVMKLLQGYYADLHDWRLVNYSFNAGESAIRKLVDQHGMPPPAPAIPRLPVKQVTREHLAKLLAIACVVREPERFGVTLPALPAGKRLEPVSVPSAMPIAKAADQAGMPVEDLKELNAAFRDGMVDHRAGSRLLLPHDNAEQFRSALLQGPAGPDTRTAALGPPLAAVPSASAKEASTDTDDPPSAARPGKSAPDPRPHTGKTHTVGKGENLWTIAHRYRIEVKQLQRWNHLRGQELKPGQVLKVSSPD